MNQTQKHETIDSLNAAIEDMKNVVIGLDALKYGDLEGWREEDDTGDAFRAAMEAKLGVVKDLSKTAFQRIEVGYKLYRMLRTTPRYSESVMVGKDVVFLNSREDAPEMSYI